MADAEARAAASASAADATADAAPDPPMRIWQTWKSHDPSTFHSVYALCQPSWQALHPRAPYALLDDAEGAALARAHFAPIADVYDRLPLGVMRADMLRCMLLFLHGGLYVDMDFMALRDHEPLWSAARGVVLGRLGHSSVHDMPNAWMMAKQPRDIFWLAVLERAANECNVAMRHKLPLQERVETATGPVLLRNVALQYNMRNGAVTHLCPRLLAAVGGVRTTTRCKIQMLAPDAVYPCDWQDNPRLREMREWRAEAREDVAARLPASYAWTSWTHNW